VIVADKMMIDEKAAKTIKEKIKASEIEVR
jgi:hypothetical protein